MPDHARDKALVFTGPVLYYYISDHLGTPQMVLDETGEIVWQGDYLPFGEMIVTADKVGNSIRFPGQYFDAETGLHYNWHRFYDPATGRYMTADPIGLAGGINLYAYALSSPTNFTDPEGLTVYKHMAFRSFALAMTAAKAAKKQIMKGANYCKNIRCKIANHPAHHKFGWPFNKRMPHIQLTCWVKGKKGTHKILRFPYSNSLTGGSGGGPSSDPPVMP